MLKKVKDKWENWKYKDYAEAACSGFYSGFAAASTFTVVTMFVLATITGKKWNLVDE